MAPTVARAAGTTEPTARNFEATATPQASPSELRATIEKVTAATYCSFMEERPQLANVTGPALRRPPGERRAERGRMANSPRAQRTGMLRRPVSSRLGELRCQFA